MKGERSPEEYRDIIGLDRPGDDTHPKMPMENRAAQFLPFAALTGFVQAVRDTDAQHLYEVEHELFHEMLYEEGEDHEVY